MAELKIELKYVEGEPVIREITRVSKPGRRVYSRDHGPAAGLQRPRHLDPVDAARRHVGQRSPRRQCRRRSALPRVLRIEVDVAHRQKSRGHPAGVTVDLAGGMLTAKGKLGTLTLAVDDDVEATVEDGKVVRRRRRPRPSAPACMWGTTRALVNNMVDGRLRGLHRQSRDQRRRLPRRGAGQEPGAAARLQPRRQFPDPGRHQDHVREADRRSRSPAPTSSASARSRRRSAPIRKPEPYKGKGIKYDDETSAARKARRSRSVP